MSTDELEEEVIEMRLDTQEMYQTIIGFGGAFTDAAGLNILSLPLKLQDTVLRCYLSSLQSNAQLLYTTIIFTLNCPHYRYCCQVVCLCDMLSAIF